MRRRHRRAEALSRSKSKSLPTHSILSKLASSSTSPACLLLRNEARFAATIMANGTLSWAARKQRTTSLLTSGSLSTTMRRDFPAMSSSKVSGLVKKLSVKLISRTTSLSDRLARRVSLAINSISASHQLGGLQAYRPFAAILDVVTRVLLPGGRNLPNPPKDAGKRPKLPP